MYKYLTLYLIIYKLFVWTLLRELQVCFISLHYRKAEAIHPIIERVFRNGYSHGNRRNRHLIVIWWSIANVHMTVVFYMTILFIIIIFVPRILYSVHPRPRRGTTCVGLWYWSADYHQPLQHHKITKNKDIATYIDS